MGSLRLTLCAASVLAAALTPTAHAADTGVSVTPSPPAPGSDIQVHARGCTGRAGTASSEAFVADAVLTGKNGALAGETRVRTSARPGTYRIRITCDGVEGGTRANAALTVGARARASFHPGPTAPRT
ncbi:hypothetical protein FNH04_44690, partial [Streptomyces phyllanthi]|nr:hypothetical protein [Streptomyces phyllanthi]